MAAAQLRVLVTHNGRFGDLLWSLPVVRAISRRIGVPVDVMVPEEFKSICPLLQQQEYIEHARYDGNWSHADRAYPYRDQVGPYDAVIDLGYRGWPLPNVIDHTIETANLALSPLMIFDREELLLDHPWIIVEGGGPQADLVIGFTETWYELKLGIMACLAEGLPATRYLQLSPGGSRWWNEAPLPDGTLQDASNWVQNAQVIRNADRFLGDCSALHVLAVALGTPVLLVEPMEARHNPVFYPLGWGGPQVTIIKGTDGKPTHDARHVADALTGFRSAFAPIR